MSMEDARLDHLTLRLDSLRQWLLLRAGELEKPLVTHTYGSGSGTGSSSEPAAHLMMMRRMLAAEFREIAASLE
jgi:hypothetical protein